MKVPVPPSGHRLASTQTSFNEGYAIDAQPEDPLTLSLFRIFESIFYLKMCCTCVPKGIVNFLAQAIHCTECSDEEVLPFGANNANLCNSAGGHLKGQHAVVTFAAFCRYSYVLAIGSFRSRPSTTEFKREQFKKYAVLAA